MAFRALLTERGPDGSVTSSIRTLEDSQLPEGDVLVSIEWAGFNYKDGLALTGQGRIVRQYPHVGGVDFAGRVIESRDGRYRPGDAVVLTGWRVGEWHWGGFATRARVKGDWLVPLPPAFSTRDAMVLGTAGLTAMLAISRLEANGLTPDRGEVLVTGASGGVGSLAVMLLSGLGFDVVAVTGRPENGVHLEKLGAATIMARSELLQESGKVLEKERWAGVIDNVAGPMLGNILKQVRSRCGVAAVGLAGGADWNASIAPFILRGVSLYGIDSVMQPYEARIAAWERLANLYRRSVYEDMVSQTGLEGLPAAAADILKGRVRGKLVVNPRERENE